MEVQTSFALELRNEGVLYQRRPKAPTFRFFYGRSILLRPLEQEVLAVNRCIDLDATCGTRESAVFDGIRAKLIEHKRQRQHSIGRHIDIRGPHQKPPISLCFERIGGCRQDRAYLGRSPIRLQEEVMNTTERVEPTFNGPLSILDTLCRPKAQRCNRLHRSQNVLHAGCSSSSKTRCNFRATSCSAASTPAFASNRRRSKFSTSSLISSFSSVMTRGLPALRSKPIASGARMVFA